MAYHLHLTLWTWDAVIPCTPVTIFFPLVVWLRLKEKKKTTTLAWPHWQPETINTVIKGNNALIIQPTVSQNSLAYPPPPSNQPYGWSSWGSTKSLLWHLCRMVNHISISSPWWLWARLVCLQLMKLTLQWAFVHSGQSCDISILN